MRIEGLERVQRMIRRLSSAEFDRVLQKAALAIGEHIRAEIANYPGSPRYPLRWASDKQRRYVMALVRRFGPYRRRFSAMSQNLGQSWAVRPMASTAAVVGTRVTYAPYVQSATHQQPFHADTGWVTDREAVARVKRSGVIHRIMRAAIRTFIRRSS